MFDDLVDAGTLRGLGDREYTDRLRELEKDDECPGSDEFVRNLCAWASAHPDWNVRRIAVLTLAARFTDSNEARETDQFGHPRRLQPFRLRAQTCRLRQLEDEHTSIAAVRRERDLRDFVLVPGGPFIAGANASRIGPFHMDNADNSLRVVELHPFSIDRTVITNKRYAEFLADSRGTKKFGCIRSDRRATRCWRT